MIQQLLREWPPGYGGVERVAHELACVWGGVVWSLDVQARSHGEIDAISVSYERCRLPCTPRLGRLALPAPSEKLWRLLRDSEPLHGHLPSPGVLLILIVARVLQPRRRVTAHWHCFLEPGHDLSGLSFGLYQWFALLLLPHLTGVTTTSPLLAEELVLAGCPRSCVEVLPCCLSVAQETAALDIAFRLPDSDSPLKIIFIGRLDSYKRLDWLMKTLASLSQPWMLCVVGDGPRRPFFEAIAIELFGLHSPQRVRFLGRLSEQDKLEWLAWADILVLPSDRSNEAFGIVQLEAMASGIPALAFNRRRSGMGWVCHLPGLDWSQTPQEFPVVMQRLSDDRALCSHLGRQARERYLKFFARNVWLKRLDALPQG